MLQNRLTPYTQTFSGILGLPALITKSSNTDKY